MICEEQQRLGALVCDAREQVRKRCMGRGTTPQVNPIESCFANAALPQAPAFQAFTYRPIEALSSCRSVLRAVSTLPLSSPSARLNDAENKQFPGSGQSSDTPAASSIKMESLQAAEAASSGNLAAALEQCQPSPSGGPTNSPPGAPKKRASCSVAKTGIV